ncbi:protein MpPPR_50 [Marchantia polymorpha subsp. ruderalis]|uniref:Pentatricopeptide repeat-containing protein-mitochondrial domain-containing protein n=2 Tax=Marchantia polymorpha TaxID=3197 RepID=A0AAF6BCA6_MARPO|nr:hypothetical protein MARPO_0090s0080 [Marchantia polymorpha]BBN09640.1 hypothetical protein Mp_4g21410 [Marchantia polymorpha subsp. ruderalis]|eukprot:PTQ33346.1 hypothetical protein MARPO_0090s0080 [Marchantia polymorpha]
MAPSASLQFLSFSSSVGTLQRSLSANFLPQASTSSLRLHTCRCNSEELSPKELHHLRKKKERKVLRKMKKVMLEEKRLEELARLPVVRPNYAIARFESSKPLEGWNKPRKKKTAATNQHTAELALPESGQEISSEETWSSTWSEFEAVYEDRVRSTIVGYGVSSQTDQIERQASGFIENQESQEYVLHSVADRNVFEIDGEIKDRKAEAVNGETDNSSRDALGFPYNLLDKQDRIFSEDEDTSFKDLDNFSSGNVVEEERTQFRRKTARVEIGQRNGVPIYLSAEDDDGRDRRKMRRDDMNESKQLEWLAKQLNNVGTRTDGVHFSRLMRSGGLKITDGRAVVLLQMLGARGNWRRAMQVVQWLSTRNQYPQTKSRYVFTTLLAVLGKTRRPFEALKVFKTMLEETSIYPDMAAYHSIAVTLGQAGFLEELLDLIPSLRKGPRSTKYLLNLKNHGALSPDIIIYNAVLNACVSHKDWKCALWVLDEIRREKLHPNSASYGLAIEVMVKAGKLNLAFETLEIMEQSGCYPNSLTYKVLVEGLGRARKPDAAVALVKRMEQRGMVATSGVYFALASTLCMSGQWKEAVLQVGRLAELSDRPLVATYTGLITACEKAGHWEDAISVFQYMQQVCAPNIGTYNVMIALYGRHNLFREAKRLYDRLKLGRLSPRKMYKSAALLAPDMFTYDAMLGACAVCSEWESLESTYQEMLSQGYELTSKRHTWILEALSKSGKHDLVEAMFTRILSKNETVPSEIYRIITCSCILVRRDEEAFSYLAEMVKQGMSISSKQLQKFQEVACSLADDEREEFLNLLDQLQVSGDFPFEASGKPVTGSDQSSFNNRNTYQELQASMMTHERGRTSYRREATTFIMDRNAVAHSTVASKTVRADFVSAERNKDVDISNYPAQKKKKVKVKKPVYKPDPELPDWELLWTAADHVQRDLPDSSLCE